MADDSLLLAHWPEGLGDAMLFRHYGWLGDCFTFGYSQAWSYACEQVPLPPEAVQLVRRATGGGVVDHRNDWTYSLLIPTTNPAYRGSSDQLYQRIHQAIADALEHCGQPAGLNPCPKSICENSIPVPNIAAVNISEVPPHQQPASHRPTVCFEKPEIYDTLEPRSGRKQAGAALKRNKQGLLLQGSIDKLACPSVSNWRKFAGAFIRALANAFDAKTMHADWPKFPEESMAATREQFASAEWNQRR